MAEHDIFPHKARPTPSPDKPFAYFQLTYGWGNWEQVVEEAKDQPGVIAAYVRHPPTAECEPMTVETEEGYSEWIHPLPGYLMQCCDCGLVHEMEFCIGDRDGDGPLNEGESDETGVILFRARRHK